MTGWWLVMNNHQEYFPFVICHFSFVIEAEETWQARFHYPAAQNRMSEMENDK
jgi:hypothetical protein